MRSMTVAVGIWQDKLALRLIVVYLAFEGGASVSFSI